MPGAEVAGPGPGPSTDTLASAGSGGTPGLGSRVQVSPHRLAVVLLVREYCHYKMSVPVTPRDRSAACLLILSLVQSPDLDLATSCKKISEKVRLPGLVVAWARGVCRLQDRA